MKMVTEQMELSRELPVVTGNVDYKEFLGRLEEVDRLLRKSGLENEFVQRQLTRWEDEIRQEAKKEGGALPSE